MATQEQVEEAVLSAWGPTDLGGTRKAYVIYQRVLPCTGQGAHLLIIASVNRFNDEHGDWACYLGGVPQSGSRDGNVHWVAEHGAKLHPIEVERFCPGLIKRFKAVKLPYRL